MTTHDVTNQTPPRVNVNEFTANVPLVETVKHYDAAWALAELEATGELVGSADFQKDARLAHEYPPVLHTHDAHGHRIDEVEYHPSYHRIMGAAVAAGAHTSAWADPRPGANVARAAQFMLFAQVEPGHACPISMTHAVVPSLQFSPQVAEKWLPQITSRFYDPVLADGKAGAIFGMAMTEKQGGSDVRANTTSAVDAGEGTWKLTGHKWFCSAPMSDAFLVLAQAPGGLSCFLVPRVLPGGQRNAFAIQRLKDKLGNKSNASCEVEFDSTSGWLIGEEGRGVRTIIEMVARTRLDNVFGAAAGMRQAVAEAVWHARHREVFGARLIDQPAMAAVLADLALESEAATVTAMRLARAHDEDAPGSDVTFRRLATAVAKYWVTKRGPEHAYEAMECLGGNGYVEDFPLARRYREQPVMAIWEGSGNVIALDVLRALVRDPESLQAFEAEVARAEGFHPLFDTHLHATRDFAQEVGRRAAAGDPTAEVQARPLVEDLALTLQASLLLRTAPAEVSEAFIDTRLGTRGHMYGVLAEDADTGAILARH